MLHNTAPIMYKVLQLLKKIIQEPSSAKLKIKTVLFTVSLRLQKTLRGIEYPNPTYSGQGDIVLLVFACVKQRQRRRSSCVVMRIRLKWHRKD